MPGKSPVAFSVSSGGERDVETLIVFAQEKLRHPEFRYPYTSGHVMIVPYAHTADFGQLDPKPR